MASRSLLEGILTVRRIDFLLESGDGTRATVMVDLVLVSLLVFVILLPDTVRRERDMLGVEGVLEAVRDARERRERPGGIARK